MSLRNPFPSQCSHGSRTICPFPRQWPQVEICRNMPNPDRCSFTICPVPLQCSQSFKPPSFAPVPLQGLHGMLCGISNSFSTPAETSSRLTSRSYRKSAPRRFPAVDDLPEPNRLSKILPPKPRSPSPNS